jgi:hypothetical protein
VATTNAWTSTDQNALDLLTQTLNSWGLGSLVKDLKGFIVSGDTSPDTLTLKLQQTDAYKQRFAGNEQRKALGLPELSPAQYIATEEQYYNILQSYGLPRGFYDKHTDFVDFIGKDISPAELDARAKIAHDQYMAAPETTKALWSQYFGGKGDAIAAILDPTVATQVIQDRSTQVGIGGAAAAQGLGVDQARAQQFQQGGVTIDGARKAYAQIAQSMPVDSQIAQRFGNQAFGQKQEEDSLLLNDATATQQRQSLYGAEEALFKGHGGADANSLGVSQTSF